MKVAFYGDSIVTGWHGISCAERRWSSTVSATLGWHELNVAANGLGFVRWRGPGRTHSGEALGLLTDVLTSGAEACVVALGVNDSVVVEELHDEIRGAIGRDLAALVDRFGRERVAVLDLYSPFGAGKPPGWRAVRALLEAGVQEHGLDLVPGLSDAICLDPELLCPDGLHPNDAGHAALAVAVTPGLRSTFA